jgi:hypothetical protein
MQHAIFSQPEGNNGGKYGKAGEYKRENDIKAYVKAGLFHGISDNKMIELIKLTKLIELSELVDIASCYFYPDSVCLRNFL